MKNTKAIKKIIKAVLFLLLLAVCTYYVTKAVQDKNNYLKNVPFYEEEEPFDVLFFGSSRMLNAMYPMELWDEYGLTAYNMSQHSEGTNVTYWQMKNAFQYNTPKVAVVDLTLLRGGKITDEDEETKSYLHKSLDHMPFSKLKYDALVDLTEGVDIWEYLFPFAMYHNRWNELERIDFYPELPARKGAEDRVEIERMEGVDWSNQALAEYVDTESVRLDDMITLCEEKGVQLIFTCMPSIWIAGNPDVCATMNYIEAYAAEHNVPFLNFAKDDDMINYTTDYHDSSHVNPSGAKKLTNSVGQFLVENYWFYAKEEATKAKWEQAKSDYMGVKLGEMELEKYGGTADCYLLLLANDNDFTFEIRMPDKSYIETFMLQDILAEMQVTEEDIIFDMTEEAIEITVYEKETGEYFHSARFTK